MARRLAVTAALLVAAAAIARYAMNPVSEYFADAAFVLLVAAAIFWNRPGGSRKA